MLGPFEATRSFWESARGPQRGISQAVDVTEGMRSLQRILRPLPPTSLNGPIGPHRRWDWARGRLADIKTIRAAHGGTVNDVVLTVITRGFRDLLLSRGESVRDRVVRTMVPVSVRAQHERGTYNNKVSAMFAELPVGIEDPIARLDSVRTQLENLKQSKQAVAGEQLTAMSGFAPAMLLDLAGRVATRTPQRNVQTLTTNVPGPQSPLYLAGRRMLEAFPFVPLGSSIRTGIGIFSYDGALTYGITGDWESAPDIRILANGIEEATEELLATASDEPKRSGARGQRRRANKASPAASD
jgi:diacylglycerol O-acyltransferase / wax synthase